MTKQLSGPALLSSQARFAVIPGLTRDPVPSMRWIADQVRNDKTAKRPCFAVIPGLTRDPVPRDSWIADVETPDPGSSPGQALIRGRDDHLASELSDDLPVLRETRQQVLTPRQTEISKIKTRCHRAADQ